jgi:hypothetical protein
METVTVVSVIYNTLALILGEVNTTSNLSSYHALSNSKIISSTVMPVSNGKLEPPVRIVLENSEMVRLKYFVKISYLHAAKRHSLYTKLLGKCLALYKCSAMNEDFCMVSECSFRILLYVYMVVFSL